MFKHAIRQAIMSNPNLLPPGFGNMTRLGGESKSPIINQIISSLPSKPEMENLLKNSTNIQPNKRNAMHGFGGGFNSQSLFLGNAPIQRIKNSKNILKSKSFLDSINFAQLAGQDGDSILAHINPSEANELGKKYGYDINPYTGLPQYGLFKKVEKFVRKKVVKPVSKFLQSRTMQKIIPTVAGVVGHIVGGPAGAAIGAGVGRAVTHRQNMGKSLLQGGIKGGALAAGASMLGGALGSPTMIGGQGFSGLPFASANSQRMGAMDSLRGVGGGNSGFMGNMFGNGPGSIAGGLSNMGSGLFGGGSGGAGGIMGSLGGGGGAGGGILSSLGGPLGAGLLGLGIAGTLKGRERVMPEMREQRRQELEDYKNIPVAELSAHNYKNWGPEYQPRRVKPLKRKYNANFNPLEDVEPEFFDDANPAVEYYASGGHVTGSSGGQQDDRQMYVPPGSHVITANEVSLLGDGNPVKGAKELMEMEERFFNSGLVKSHNYMENFNKNARYLPVHVSDNEYIISPQTVSMIGKGNNKEGQKKIYKGRKALRNHKGLKSVLPPKSKSILEYMR